MGAVGRVTGSTLIVLETGEEVPPKDMLAVGAELMMIFF